MKLKRLISAAVWKQCSQSVLDFCLLLFVSYFNIYTFLASCFWFKHMNLISEIGLEFLYADLQVSCYIILNEMICTFYTFNFDAQTKIRFNYSLVLLVVWVSLIG